MVKGIFKFFLSAARLHVRLAYIFADVLKLLLSVAINYITRHTHSVNASCSYEVHEDIICILTNGSLEYMTLL